MVKAFSNLKTQRFTLKVLTPELVGEDYLSWFSNPVTTNYIEYAKQDVTLESLKKYAQEKYESQTALFLGIFFNESMQHIGNIKFEPIDFEKRFAVLGVLIGAEEWRGRGVFSEISQIIEKTLNQKKIRKIYLGVEKSNESAIKAYIKQGYIVDEANFLNSDLSQSVCMVKDISFGK